MVAARGLGEGRGGSFELMGMKFQFYSMEGALELDGSDGCPTCECT